MMKIRFLNSPLFGLAVLLLLGGMIGTLIFTQIDRVYYTRSMVMHTYEVISSIDRISQTMVDAESSVRGYFITGKEEYLAPLKYASENPLQRKGHLYEQIDHLRSLMVDNPIQKQNLSIAEELMTAKIAYITEVAKAVPDKAKKEALLSRKSQKGKILMDQIKLQMMQMRDTEEKLLQIRIDKDKKTSQLVISITLGLLILMVGVISAAFVAIHKEFQRRQKAEKDLEENLVFQNTILENSMYIIIAAYPNGIIRLFNKSAEKLLGYSAGEIINRYTAEIFHDKEEMKTHAKHLEEVFNQPVKDDYEVFIKKPIKTGSEEREWTYISKEGTRIPVLLSVATLRDNKGKITGYVSIAKDISERKQIDRMKDEFISTVSHELRTPLTSIRGSLGLVANHMQHQLNEKISHLVGIAYKNTERLTRLINDILDIEKIESGNIILQKNVIVISNILQKSADELQGFANQYQVKLSIKDHTNGATVIADADRFQQVLDNLVSNAIKYSPPYEVVTLSAENKGKDICISVEDHGLGVPEGFKSKIFGKFAQADSSTSRRKNGTGLGLSICKSLVETMGGQIHFDSVAGKTRFYFTLPSLNTSMAQLNTPDNTRE